MNSGRWLQHRIANWFQSVLLIGAMGALVGLMGWLLGGTAMAVLSVVMVITLFLVQISVSPKLVVRLYHGRVVTLLDSPRLYAILEALARRAELPSVPTLYYLPSDVMNAFAVGSRRNAVIVISHGMLRRMSLREVAGVLAHEISHIHHNDLRVMGLADVFSRLTSLFSLTGQLLVLVNLPLILFADYHISWLVILLLIFAPAVSAVPSPGAKHATR